MKYIRRHGRDAAFPDGISEVYQILPMAVDGDHLDVRYHRTGTPSGVRDKLD
jgi:hypothetical protein